MNNGYMFFYEQYCTYFMSFYTPIFYRYYLVLWKIIPHIISNVVLIDKSQIKILRRNGAKNIYLVFDTVLKVLNNDCRRKQKDTDSTGKITLFVTNLSVIIRLNLKRKCEKKKKVVVEGRFLAYGARFETVDGT